MAAETGTVVQETPVVETPATEPAATPPAPTLESKPMWDDEPAAEEVKSESKATDEKPAEAPVEKPAPKERDYGKEMQRMAQRQAAVEKKLEQTLEEKLKASEDRILKALESKLTPKSEPKDEPPAANPATALKEKLKSIRSQSLAEPEVLDVLEPLIEQILQDSGKRFSQADIEAMTQKAVDAELLRREALTGEQRAKEAQQRREADERMADFKQRFADDNPERAAEFDDLVSRWQTTFAKRYKGLNLTPESAQEKSDEVWNEVLSEKPVPKKSKSDPKDTIGATTVPSGGSATRATATQRKDIPLWTPD